MDCEQVAVTDFDFVDYIAFLNSTGSKTAPLERRNQKPVVYTADVLQFIHWVTP